MTRVFVLLECTVGYVLLKAKKCKTIDKLSEILNDKHFETLKEKFELVNFKQFVSIDNAKINSEALAKGKTTKDLNKMLRKHLTDEDAVLVTMDKRLCDSLKAEAISPELKFSAESAIIFKLRTLRFNIHKFIGYTVDQIDGAANGLATALSRGAIQYNDDRSDSMVIQSIGLIDHQDKVINKLCMKIREWFGYHFPELFKIVPDNKKYCQIVDLIKCRGNAAANEEGIEEILLDSTKAQSIIDMARVSVGYELTENDFSMIQDIVKDILSNMAFRDQTAEYLSKKMAIVCPNLSTLIGDIVAARLIAHAGSLLNLAKSCPASTIQILGAEKALFRAIKQRSSTPKYGLLYHSHFISRAQNCDKGKISRFLASKIALAVRLDAFSEEPNNIFGEHLKKEMEDRLEHCITGNETMRNRDVMAIAYAECQKFNEEKKAKQAQESAEKTDTETPKKKKKSKKLDDESKEVNVQDTSVNAAEPSKKKKSKVLVSESTEAVYVIDRSVNDTEPPKKKKKKSKATIADSKEDVNGIDGPVIDTETPKKKKKKKSKATIDDSKEDVNGMGTSLDDAEAPKKKKKSKVLIEEPKEEVNVDKSVNDTEIPKKKKKKSKALIDESKEEVNDTEISKKKKNKIKQMDGASDSVSKSIGSVKRSLPKDDIAPESQSKKAKKQKSICNTD